MFENCGTNCLGKMDWVISWESLFLNATKRRIKSLRLTRKLKKDMLGYIMDFDLLYAKIKREKFHWRKYDDVDELWHLHWSEFLAACFRWWSDQSKKRSHMTDKSWLEWEHGWRKMKLTRRQILWTDWPTNWMEILSISMSLC